MENTTLKLIENRRSHRRYTAEQLTDGQLEALLTAAQQSPSANNLQPWYFTAVQDQAVLDRINHEAHKGAQAQDSAQRSPRFSDPEFHVFYKAPTVIFIKCCASRRGIPLSSRLPSATRMTPKPRPRAAWTRPHSSAESQLTTAFRRFDLRKNMMLKSAAIALLLTLVLGLALTAAGQAGTASISGTAFLDGNQNGLLDPGERGLEGVEVSLVKVSGLSETIIGQVRSGADGAWQFAGLAAGEYYLLAAITLADGQQLAWPFGAAKRSAYINIVAFGDTNMNGGRMTSEPLLRDVEVSLVFEQGGTQHVVAQGTTNKDGELQLRDLSPATYRLQAVMPAPYIVGPLGAKINPFYNVILPGEANTGLSEPFTLERSLGVGIGGVKAGALSGRVWTSAS